jgi:hypothetical protein
MPTRPENAGDAISGEPATRRPDAIADPCDPEERTRATRTRDLLNPRRDPVLHVCFPETFPTETVTISGGFMRKIPKVYKSYNFVD